MKTSQRTLRIWHGTVESLELFLHRKLNRETSEIVAVFETSDPKVHVFAYGNVDRDVCTALGLTLVKALAVDASSPAVAA